MDDMNKSHVSLAQETCIVCGRTFDTGEIFIDKRLRKSMNRHTNIGWGLCPEHKTLYDQGYVALVECDRSNSRMLEVDEQGVEHCRPENAHRVGRIAHLHRNAAEQMFNCSIVDKSGKLLPLVFCDGEVIDMLEQSAQENSRPKE